jgi:hypothetical protein
MGIDQVSHEPAAASVGGVGLRERIQARRRIHDVGCDATIEQLKGDEPWALRCRPQRRDLEPGFLVHAHYPDALEPQRIERMFDELEAAGKHPLGLGAARPASHTARPTSRRRHREGLSQVGLMMGADPVWKEHRADTAHAINVR